MNPNSFIFRCNHKLVCDFNFVSLYLAKIIGALLCLSIPRLRRLMRRAASIMKFAEPLIEKRVLIHGWIAIFGPRNREKEYTRVLHYNYYKESILTPTFFLIDPDLKQSAFPEHLRGAHEALAGVLPAEPDPRRPRREVHPQAVARARQDRALPQPPQRDQGRPGERIAVMPVTG